MSSASLDLVRSICAAWERGDYSSVDWADPEIEFVIADGPEPGRFTGLGGLTGLRDFQSAWQEYHSEAVEYRQLDEERVLVLTYASGRGKASGLEIGQRRANVFHVRGAKVTRLVAYWDRERALADLGLAPDAGTAEERPAGERFTGEESAQPYDALTLSTTCACGHPRRDHRGLRIKVSGPCLECGCEEFRRALEVPDSHEPTMKIRAALDRVERLQEIVAGLHAQVNGEVLNRQEWLALRREFCGREPLPVTNVEVAEDGDVGFELAGDEFPSMCAQLRIRHCRGATIVAIERVALYVGAQEAMLVVALGDCPIKRWRVLWRGNLNALAPAHSEPMQ